MSGGSGGDSSTQTVVPWGPVQPYLKDAYERLNLGQTPEYFPGQTVAPTSPYTETGIAQVAQAAAPQQAIVGDAAEGFGFTMNDLLKPETNQYLQSTAEGAIKPIFEQLERTGLGNVDDAAILAGQFGGTAQRGERQEAIDQATQRALDTTSQIYSDAYQTSLDNYTQTLLGTPGIAGAQIIPGQTSIAAGDLSAVEQQRLLNAEIERFNYGQTAEFDYLNQYINTLLGVPMGSQTTTPGGGTSALQAGLGGAATGAAIGSVIPGIGTAIGAGVGGAAGLILS